MKIGTRSVLYGAHCFFVHPWFVAASWLKLYGFRTVYCPSSKVRTSIFDWRLWVIFFIHDLGYWSKPNMDGNEGELHPIWAASLAHRWFDSPGKWYWRDFTMYHSRFLARIDHREPSLFCWADKYAIYLTPSWLYIPMTRASGELTEYMHVNPREIKGHGRSALEWHTDCREYCRKLALEHKDGRPDTWTPRAVV